MKLVASFFFFEQTRTVIANDSRIRRAEQRYGVIGAADLKSRGSGQ